MAPTKKPTILVVDDDPDLSRIMSIQLQAEGYAVDTAGDGAEAFAYLQDRKPDCIVLDVMMPVMDGFALLKRIRSLDALQQIPVLILTASEDLRYRRKSDIYQADAFLNKPFQIEELTEAVGQLCDPALP